MKPPEGKILIVDDDPDVRSVMSMLLDMKGFETLDASTKQAALELVPSLGGLGVGAVLIDGNLSASSRGGADGKEINAAIKAAWGEAIKTAGISATDPIPGADNPRMNIDDVASFRQEIDDL